MATPVAVPIPMNEMGMDETERAKMLARRYHSEFVDLKNFKISARVVQERASGHDVPVQLRAVGTGWRGKLGDRCLRPFEADGARRDLGAAGAEAGDTGSDSFARSPIC